MERVPILAMGDYLLVSIQIDMTDLLVGQLQDELCETIARRNSKGLMLDISALDAVDSFVARTIANIAGITRLLDARTVVVGMRPAVAITLTELGLDLPGVRTALSVEKGMAMLRRDIDADGAHGRPA